MGGIDGARVSESVVEPIVGVQSRSVPVVLSISMEGIAAGFCEVVHACTRGSAKLPGITITDDGRFLDLVLAHQHSHHAAVVGIHYGVVVVHSVESEQIGSARHTQY